MTTEQSHKYIVICKSVNRLINHLNIDGGFPILFLRSFVNHRSIKVIKHRDDLRTIENVEDYYTVISSNGKNADLFHAVDLAYKKHVKYMERKESKFVPWREFLDAEFEAWKNKHNT